MPKTKLEQELSEVDYIYVLSADGEPLMPTRRRGHVKRLLNRGKARIVSHAPFVIQLKYDGPKNTQPLFGGIDPGLTNIGAAVVTPEGKCVYRSHTASRNKEVPKDINQLVQTHESLIRRISAILPVTDWTLETNKRLHELP